MAAVGLRVDLHVKVLDERVVNRAKRRGLDALVYAPHFTRLPDIEATAARYGDEDLLVLPAREVFTGPWHDRKHVLALDLEAPVPDFLTLPGTMAELERQDAVALAPHPEFFTIGLSAADIEAHRAGFRAVETYNPKHLGRHNRRAREIAKAVDRPGFASSYAHLRGTVGAAWTTFPGVEKDSGAILEALRAGDPLVPEHDAGPRHRLRCAAEAGHLLYENSVSKVDRVVLSGMEATHPRHPAYGGRFDDVAVY